MVMAIIITRLLSNISSFMQIILDGSGSTMQVIMIALHLSPSQCHKPGDDNRFIPLDVCAPLIGQFLQDEALWLAQPLISLSPELLLWRHLTSHTRARPEAELIMLKWYAGPPLIAARMPQHQTAECGHILCTAEWKRQGGLAERLSVTNPLRSMGCDCFFNQPTMIRCRTGAENWILCY